MLFQMMAWIYTLISYFVLFNTRVFSSCPPLNSYECIYIPRYNGGQYATCLTATYIKEFSNQRHHCTDPYATYCWYQCMMEVHDVNDGDVTPDCSCDSMNTTVSSDLPAECYSPSGQDCNWYTDCLEKRYPCKNESASYAVDYAKRFCSLYEKHYNEFSSGGQAWIDGVRKCLQVKLVPTLRPGQQKTCDQLMKFAFNTHEECYINPDRVSSVCDIPSSDYSKIFWTLTEGYDFLWKENRHAFWKAMLPTFKQMFSVGSSCATQKISNSVVEFGLSVQNGIDDISNWFSPRKRRSATQINITVEDLVFKTSNQVSNTMSWENKEVMWFAYPIVPSNSSENGTSSLSVRIAITAKAMYDLNAQNVSMANVTQVVHNLSQAIVDGSLEFDLGEGVRATKYGVCSDIKCGDSTFEAVPRNQQPQWEEPDEEESNLGLYIGIGVGASAAIGLLILVIVFYLRTH